MQDGPQTHEHVEKLRATVSAKEETLYSRLGSTSGSGSSQTLNLSAFGILLCSHLYVFVSSLVDLSQWLMQFACTKCLATRPWEAIRCELKKYRYFRSTFLKF